MLNNNRLTEAVSHWCLQEVVAHLAALPVLRRWQLHTLQAAVHQPVAAALPLDSPDLPER